MSDTAADGSIQRQKRTLSDESRMNQRFYRNSHDRLKLTKTERKCLQAVGDGLTRLEAANALYISVRTIEWHLANCFDKLGQHTIMGAFFEAVRRGECVCPCRRLDDGA